MELGYHAPVSRTVRPLLTFLRTETAGGLLLLVAAVVALIVVNSPLGDSYEKLLRTDLGLTLGGLDVGGDVRHWVNDVLMTIFFFVVGLEIKRELVDGELASPRKAALPAIAAVGGMIVPALIYVALNAGGAGAQGWGIPMATDIAFAVGVLALLGPRVPAGLKVFLLSLAIVDDVGAITVIAIFYTNDLSLGWLFLAGLAILGILGLRVLNVKSVTIYLIAGLGLWLATLGAGIHVTIAGVLLGLSLPTSVEGTDDPAAVRLERILHPWTSFVIVPLFAFVNAGVLLTSDVLADAFSSDIAWGIVLGLIVGKIVGITGTSWVALRLRIAEPVEGMDGRHLVGVSALAGIGFTVSIFITGLAFDDPASVGAAKIGILSASLAAGILGSIVLLSAPDRPPQAALTEDLSDKT
jgi:NhaA family Na+:H+ antiporter